MSLGIIHLALLIRFSFTQNLSTCSNSQTTNPICLINLILNQEWSLNWSKDLFNQQESTVWTKLDHLNHIEYSIIHFVSKKSMSTDDVLLNRTQSIKEMLYCICSWTGSNFQNSNRQIHKCVRLKFNLGCAVMKKFMLWSGRLRKGKYLTLHDVDNFPYYLSLLCVRLMYSFEK